MDADADGQKLGRRAVRRDHDLAGVENLFAAEAQAPQGRVTFIGLGSEDPELLTIKAQRKLQEADVIVHDGAVPRAILELAREIDSMAQSNRDLLARGRDAAHQTLISLGELDPETYSAQGTTEGANGRARLVNEAM